MSKIWFSSDWHLGHKNITGPKVSTWPKGYRIFDTTEQMNREIIGTMNSYIKQDDTLYFLGDFSFKGAQNLNTYRDQIWCKNIVFIKGNHDKEHSLLKITNVVYPALEVDIAGIRICMSHYSHRVWNKSHHGSIHLYGHSHGTLEKYPWGKSMDVGVDNAYAMFGKWRPFEFEEIVSIMNKREIAFVDHHVVKR